MLNIKHVLVGLMMALPNLIIRVNVLFISPGLKDTIAETPWNAISLQCDHTGFIALLTNGVGLFFKEVQICRHILHHPSYLSCSVCRIDSLLDEIIKIYISNITDTMATDRPPGDSSSHGTISCDIDIIWPE